MKHNIRLAYSLDPCYCGTVTIDGEQFGVILKCKAKPEAHSSHVGTTTSWKNKTELVEWRFKDPCTVVVDGILLTKLHSNGTSLSMKEARASRFFDMKI